MLWKIQDNEFIMDFIRHATQIIYEKDAPIYCLGDFAENFYIIEKGAVRLIALNGFPFYEYVKGDTFGESDALLKELRDCKVVAHKMCTLYSIKFEDVEDLLK